MTEIDESVIAAAWDQNAETWTELVRAGKDFFRDVFNNPCFFAFLPDLADKQVLDLGCGEGTNTRLLARRGLRLTGVDFSTRMIAAARAAETSEPLGIDYRVGSFTSLEAFQDASFDAAISTMALMDSLEFDQTARAVFRVLRRGGSFSFSVEHPCFETPGTRWLYDSNGREEGLVISDYFAGEAYMKEWRFKSVKDDEAPPFVCAKVPYRMEHYVNGLCDAGFRILRMEEARPTTEMVAAYPRLARLRRHRALFLYISAAKD